jgi:hypothetical protein
LVSGRRIPMRRLIQDIYTGMEDVALMEKYRLSAEDLKLVYENLLDGRIPSLVDITDNLTKRLSPRTYIFFALPVSLEDDPDTRGVVNDLSHKGLQVAGIDTIVGETKTFVIRHDLFPPDAPLRFEAVCRWTAQDETDWDCISGFEITAISPEASQQLQDLIALLTNGELF